MGTMHDQTDPATFRDLIAALDPADLDTLAAHGAGSGIPGLIYTGDLLALYDRHRDELWERVASDADDFGSRSALSLLGSLDTETARVNGHDELATLLVWYVAEGIAHEIVAERDGQGW